MEITAADAGVVYAQRSRHRALYRPRSTVLAPWSRQHRRGELMVVEVTQQAAGVGLGIKSTEKIGISNLAKRRRKQSAAGGRADAKTKAMLAGVVAVALVAVMCNGGGEFRPWSASTLRDLLLYNTCTVVFFRVITLGRVKQPQIHRREQPLSRTRYQVYTICTRTLVPEVQSRRIVVMYS